MKHGGILHTHVPTQIQQIPTLNLCVSRYTMGYVETVRGAKKGQTILQVGVGSGVKCGVNVWRALRDVRDVQPAWEERLTPEQLAVAKKEMAKSKKARVGGAGGVFGSALFVVLLAVLLAVVYHHLSGLYGLPPLMEKGVADAMCLHKVFGFRA